MFTLFSNIGIMLAQTASEKKLTVLYLLLFALFLMVLLLDSRTAKKYTGPKIIAKTIIIMIFVVAVLLLIAYLNMQ